MKRCSAGAECLHPDGPELPLSEFNRDRSKKDGYATRCKPCKYAKIQAWNRKHKDKLHRYGKDYRTRHPGEGRERERRWRATNPEKEHAKQRRYHHEHLDLAHARGKRWRASHRDYIRRQQHERRAKKKQTLATFTDAHWRQCLDYFRGACAYCGKPPRLWDDPPILHQEHFIPVASGGAYTPNNILPGCQTCNFSKRDYPASEWLTDHFGPRKAKAILKRIEQYFAWVKSQS